MAKIMKRTVDALQPEAGRDVFAWDTELRGFGVIQPRPQEEHVLHRASGSPGVFQVPAVVGPRDDGARTMPPPRRDAGCRLGTTVRAAADKNHPLHTQPRRLRLWWGNNLGRDRTRRHVLPDTARPPAQTPAW